MINFKKQKPLNKRWCTLIVLIFIGLSFTACTNRNNEVISTPETTVEYPPMTEVEDESFNTKLALLEENAVAFENTGEIKSSEELYATIQELDALNLNDEEMQQISAVIKRLPEVYQSFSEGITGKPLE